MTNVPLRWRRWATNAMRRMFVFRSSFAETETLRQVLAHDIAVEELDRHVGVGEFLLEDVSDRGLARAGQPGEPDHYASVSIYLLHMNPFRRICNCRSGDGQTVVTS